MAKVTVYVDDDVWNKFRASVFNRHGTLKVLSKEVEGSVKSTMVEETVSDYLTKLASQLKPRTRERPVLKGPSAGVMIRNMRRRRFESLSR